MTVEVRALPSEAFLVHDTPKFVDTRDLHKLFGKILSEAVPKNLILHGPKGVSKTLSIQSFAKDNKIPLIVSECSEDTRRSTLTGTFIIEGNLTPFVLGDLTNAIEVANETGTAILCLEEVNALPPQIQKMLNGISDFRRAISVPECKRIFKLKPGCKLWVTGTMNSSAYGGVYSLNEDFKSRFLFKEVSYPSDKEEMHILKTLYPTAEKAFLEGILVVSSDLRNGNALQYKLSTRDLCQWVEIYPMLGLKESISLISGKFESENDRTLFMTRCSARFKGA
jgi:MoxR-like ATPase